MKPKNKENLPKTRIMHHTQVLFVVMRTRFDNIKHACFTWLFYCSSMIDFNVSNINQQMT